MEQRRRKPKIEERLTPCMCCKYPLTERHHILDFVTWGEALDTWQLCANCHEILHIAFAAIILKKKRSTELWENFEKVLGEKHPTIQWIYERIEETLDLSFEMTIKHSE